MIILDKIQESLNRFLALENVDENNIILFDEEISSIVKNFSMEKGSSNDDIKTAMEKYIEIFNSEGIKKHLQKYELELDVEKFSQELSSIELATLFEELLIKSKRDCVISDIRKEAEMFYQNENKDQYEIISKAKNEIKDTMLLYVNNLEVFHKALSNFYGKNIDKYNLNRNIALAYNSLSFLCSQFRLDYYLQQHEENICREDLFESISKFINSNEIMKFSGSDSMENHMHKMHIIADNFFENQSYYTEAYVMEVVQELKDIVTDYLYYYSHKNPNNAATVFDSFLYLNEKMGVFKAWNTFLDEEYNFEDVYSYCQNESLVPYLKALQTKDYAGAVEINSEYEIAHYHLLLNQLMNIGDSLENVGRLTEQESKEIYLHYSYMGEVLEFTDSFTYSSYLESAFTYNFESLNFGDVLSILKRENELREKNSKLDELNKALEEAIEAKNEMIDRHAHNWKHISYPSIVKEVAEKLAGDENYKSYANKLFKAYNSENILKQEVLMLKLKHSGSGEEIQKQIMSDVLLSTARTGVNIQKIIDDSLDLVLFRILMEDVDTSINTETVRENLSRFRDLEELRENYSKHFIVKELSGVSILEWFRSNIYSIVINFDGNWNAVKVKKDSTAYAQLVEIFIDLFHNAINYGKKDDKGFINIELGCEEVDDVQYLTLKITNPVDYCNILEKGSNQGLASMNKLLEKLNYIPDRHKKVIPTVEAGLDSSNENHFITKIFFLKKIFLKEA